LKDGIEFGLPDIPGEYVAFLWRRGGEAVKLEDSHELDDFGWAEGVEVDGREVGFEVVEHVLVKLDGQFGVHAALQENLRAADIEKFTDFLVELVFRECVGVGVAEVAFEGAEGAGCGAYVGVVDKRSIMSKK